MPGNVGARYGAVAPLPLLLWFMEDTPEEHHEPTDPAQAFEDLRAEVSVTRRAVEALPGAWEENQLPDYSPDLGRIAKGLAIVAGQLDAINKHPRAST